MKELYRKIQETLHCSFVTELTELEKAKGLSAGLLAMFEEPAAVSGKPEEEEKRIKIFIAEIREGSREAAAARMLRTAIPDVKIYTVESTADFFEDRQRDSTEESALSGQKDAAAAYACIPEICDGILTTEPESALFAKKNIEKYEQIVIGSKAGGILSAALSLASKPDYQEKNILVYLPDC